MAVGTCSYWPRLVRLPRPPTAVPSSQHVDRFAFGKGCPARVGRLRISRSRSSARVVEAKPTRSAKSLLEPGVVAYCGEVVVSARVLAEPWEQFDGPAEVGERVVAGVPRARCEARVVVMQAGVLRHVLEGTADRFER